MDTSVKHPLQETEYAEYIDSVEEVVDQDGQKRTVVNLDEKGREKFQKAMQDPSLDYIREFIQITFKNKEHVGEKLYNVVVELNDLIKKYNAPWFVPFYQGVRNSILALIFINTNAKTLFNDDMDMYSKAMSAAGEILTEIVSKFNPDDGNYNTFPIDYSITAIFDRISKECGIEKNLNEYYKENLAKIEERKAAIQLKSIKLFLTLHYAMDNKDQHLYNKMLSKGLPNKYSIKRPKKLKLEESIDVVEGLLNATNGKSFEEFAKEFKVPDYILKKLELKPEELETAKESLIKMKVIDEVPEINKLKQQLGNIEGGNEIIKNIIEGAAEGKSDEEITDEAAKKLFDKVNDELPEEMKGKIKEEFSDKLNDTQEG